MHFWIFHAVLSAQKIFYPNFFFTPIFFPMMWVKQDNTMLRNILVLEQEWQQNKFCFTTHWKGWRKVPRTRTICPAFLQHFPTCVSFVTIQANLSRCLVSCLSSISTKAYSVGLQCRKKFRKSCCRRRASWRSCLSLSVALENKVVFCNRGDWTQGPHTQNINLFAHRGVNAFGASIRPCLTPSPNWSASKCTLLNPQTIQQTALPLSSERQRTFPLCPAPVSLLDCINSHTEVDQKRYFSSNDCLQQVAHKTRTLEWGTKWFSTRFF